MKVELIRPFSPLILKAELPIEIVKILNQDCENIIDNKKEKINWSSQLAGRVKEEFHITKDLIKELSGVFHTITSMFLFPKEEDYQKNKGKFRVGISSGWYVRSFDGDFNPVHHHTGCQISCLGFLKLPDDIDNYWKEEDQDHNASGGYTDFRHGTVGLSCSNNYKVKPKVRDVYMFPSWLDHQVYPFKSKYKFPDIKGERRSFSLNIIFENV